MTRGTRAWALALLAIGLLSSATAQAPEPPPGFDATAEQQRYADAWRSEDGLFDLDALAALYAADADAVFFDEYARKPSDWSFSRSFALGRRPIAQGVRSLRLEPVAAPRVVVLAPDRVMTVGAYRLRARFEGTKPLSGTLRQTALWERRDGSWVLTHEHRSVPIEDLD